MDGRTFAAAAAAAAAADATTSVTDVAVVQVLSLALACCPGDALPDALALLQMT